MPWCRACDVARRAQPGRTGSRALLAASLRAKKTARTRRSPQRRPGGPRSHRRRSAGALLDPDSRIRMKQVATMMGPYSSSLEESMSAEWDPTGRILEMGRPRAQPMQKRGMTTILRPDLGMFKSVGAYRARDEARATASPAGRHACNSPVEPVGRRIRDLSGFSPQGQVDSLSVLVSISPGT